MGMMKTNAFLPAALAAAAFLAAAPAARAANWTKLDNAVLADGYMDGDSFHVRHNNKDYIIRLYFVDTPETDKTHPERNADQAAYFHIKDSRVVPLGEKGKHFTQQALRGEKFTVWTKWEDAKGSSSQPRYFGYVRLGDRDLGEMLVANGLARVYGYSTVSPDGKSIDQQFAYLRQLERRAKSKHLGGWNKKFSDGKEDPAADAPGSGGLFAEALEDEDLHAEIAKANAERREYVPEWLTEAEDVTEWTENVAHASVPTVAYLRAEVFVNTEQFEDAEIALRKLLKRFPNHPQRPRIEFYLALSVAMQERFVEAERRFTTWLSAHPGDPLAQEVGYWLPISYYYDGKYEEAIPLFEKYAKENPLTVYAPEAIYRAACCRYALEDYESVIRDIPAWQAAYPDHYFRFEAAIMLGDSYAALGELDQAKAAYRPALCPQAGPFYYMALTQAARVYKALGEEVDFLDLANLYIQYIKDMPQDSNIVDAAYHAGTCYRRVKQPEKARDLYWRMIEFHGNKPEWEGFDLMFKDLANMYPRDNDEYDRELAARYSKALEGQRLTLASRLACIQAQRAPEDDLPRQIAAFAGRFKTEYLGPETLLWLGRSWIENGMADDGAANLQFLLERFPDSLQVPSAETLLAQLACKKQDWVSALSFANAVINNAAEIGDLVEATFCRAEALQGLGSFSEAIADYNSILANSATPRRLKPEALIGIGNCHAAQKDWNQAIAFYQRVYVLYGAYHDSVVAAYLRAAFCFEKLGKKQEAANHYRELLDLDFVRGRAEAATARQRLAKLQGE